MRISRRCGSNPRIRSTSPISWIWNRWIRSFSTDHTSWSRKKVGKAYAVLHKALSGTGKIGIAKVVISNREHLAAVKPDGLFLILELMHFASEILSTEVLKNGSATAVTDKELKMAQALIESMSDAWEPEKYRDEYRTALMEIIEQKAKNRQIAATAAPAPAPTNVVDLVKVLQESLSRNQSVRQKRSSARSSGRSTAALVKQKR